MGRIEALAALGLAAFKKPRDLQSIHKAAVPRETLTYPAIPLFNERAIGRVGTFEIPDSNARMVSEICNSLDAIPLAMKLSAACVNVMGLEVLVDGFGGNRLRSENGRGRSGTRHKS